MSIYKVLTVLAVGIMVIWISHALVGSLMTGDSLEKCLHSVSANCK